MPGVAAVEQLNALQSALGLIGTSLFLLQAFRVNSSYGAPPLIVRMLCRQPSLQSRVQTLRLPWPWCCMQTDGGRDGVSGIQSLLAAPTWPDTRRVCCVEHHICTCCERSATLQASICHAPRMQLTLCTAVCWQYGSARRP